MFTKTSQNIRLQGNSILAADCKKQDGSVKSSSLDLDTLLGNIDGKFAWGKQTFSNSAQKVTLKDGVLVAELKNSSGAWVPATVDLNAYITNNDGLLEGVNIPGLTKKPSKVDIRPPPVTQKSMEEPWSARTLVDSASAASFSKEELLKTAVENYKEEHSSYTKTTKTATTSSYSVVYFRNLRLDKENITLLLADCLSAYGMTYETSSVNLDDYIGNLDGKLTWGYNGFKKTSRNIVLQGDYLVAECQNSHKEWVTSRLDLTKGLHCDSGKLEVLVPKVNPEFSKFMSEAPWMKFKVVTEPQMDLLLTHKAVKKSFESIAETTVKHVTSRMSRIVSVAIAAAVEEVTFSAIQHVQKSMDLQLEASLRAEIRPAETEASFLHMQMQQMLRQEFGSMVQDAVSKQLSGNGAAR